MTSDKSYATAQLLAQLGLWADSNGFNRYTPADGNTYAGGVSTTVCPGYNGTSTLTAITGCQQAVAVGRYRVDAELIITNTSSGTQAINLGLQGPALADMRVQFYLFIDNASSASVIGSASLNAMTHWTTVALNGTTLGNNSYLCQVHGTANFTAASGTLFGITTSAASAYVIVADSYMDLRPV